MKQKIKSNAFASILISSLMLSFASYAQKDAQFFITVENQSFQLFQPSEQYQDLLDANFDTNINVHQVTSHALEIEAGYTVRFDWYQNGKSRLIVLGLGKGGDFNAKRPFIREFVKYYDVIVFDYEWQNPAHWLNRLGRITYPLARYFDHNYKEIHAIVNAFRKANIYEEIIGHGECYSAFMFAKAQALKSKDALLFDKLILDSGVLSIKNCVQSILGNPALCRDPLKGESPDYTQRILGHWIISMPTQTIADLCVNDYSVEPYLKKIDIPVLFIRGKNDPMVNNQDFYTMWTMLRTSQKAAFITPYHHANSFQREGRRRYLHVENLFIQNTFQDFINNI